MKRFAMTTIVILMAFCLFAVDADLITKEMDWNSPEALLIEGSFSDQSAVGSFKQIKSLATSTRKFTSTGTMQIMPGTGIVWYTEKPYASVLVVGKNSLSQSVRGGDFTHLEIANNQIYVSIAQCMDAMFSGDFTTIQSMFKAYCLIEDGEWSLKLIPQDKTVSSFMDYIVMSGKSCLESLLIFEKSGDSVLYEISDLTYRGLTDDELAVYSH